MNTYLEQGLGIMFFEGLVSAQHHISSSIDTLHLHSTSGGPFGYLHFNSSHSEQVVQIRFSASIGP